MIISQERKKTSKRGWEKMVTEARKEGGVVAQKLRRRSDSKGSNTAHRFNSEVSELIW